MNTFSPQTLPAVTGDYAAACLLPLVSDVQIHCVLSFPAQLDTQRLARAVRLSFDAEPVLGCNPVFKRGNLIWQRQARDPSDYFGVEQTQDAEAAIKRFLCKPLDAFHESIVQAHVVRAASDTLALKVSHIAADGAAVKAYAYLLADIYRQLADNPNYTPPVNHASRSLKQISKHFSLLDKLKILRRGWRNTRDMMFPPHNWQLPLNVTQNQADYVWRKIAAPQFNALKAYGKKYQASLNDVLLTAMSRALHRHTQPPPSQVLRLINTADLRRYLSTRHAEAMCNLSGFVYLNLGTELGEHFSDTLRQVSAVMNQQKSDYLGLGDIPSWVLFHRYLPFVWNQKLLSQLFAPEKTAMPPSLTNIGAINASRLSFDTPPDDAFLTASVIFAPHFLLGVSGFNDSLCLSVGFTGGAENRRVIEAFLQDMLAELDSIV